MKQLPNPWQTISPTGMAVVGLEPTMPEGDAFTVRGTAICSTRPGVPPSVAQFTEVHLKTATLMDLALRRGYLLS